MASRNRVLFVLSIIFLLVIGGWGVRTVVTRLKSLERATVVKKEEFKRFLHLKEVYLSKKSRVDELERRLSSPKGRDSIIPLIEDVARRTGIKERIASIKPLDEKTSHGYLERGVELRIEGIDLNQAVNLLYKIENGPTLIKIKRVTLKSRFDNPLLLDILLIMAVLDRAL